MRGSSRKPVRRTSGYFALILGRKEISIKSKDFNAGLTSRFQLYPNVSEVGLCA
jgi:hypothetical protein